MTDLLLDARKFLDTWDHDEPPPATLCEAWLRDLYDLARRARKDAERMREALLSAEWGFGYCPSCGAMQKAPEALADMKWRGHKEGCRVAGALEGWPMRKEQKP
jgi:hypothetical protein